MASDIKNKYLTLSNKQLEEIADYGQGDDVELKIMCRVKSIKTTEQEPLKPGEEPPDPNENPDLIEPESFITLEIVEAEVLNKKPDRKRAEHLGISKDDLNKIGNRKSNPEMA